MWVAVAGSLLLGFKSPNHLSGYRVRRTALSFILIFLATQIFIFGFTDQGLWADTYTAINRLPLHFVPALLFAVIVIAHAKNHVDTALVVGGIIGNGARCDLSIGDDDNLELRPIDQISFSITADHRIVDGATVARFCQQMKNYIENPNLMLVSM